MSEKILINKTVVLTHPYSESSEQFCNYFRNAGANVYHFPMVEIATTEFSESIFSKIHEYDNIIFTSRNGVKYFLKNHEIISNIKNSEINIICIGTQTKQTLNTLGLPVNIIPKEYNSDSLLNELKQKINNKILLIQGNLAPDKLEITLSKKNTVERVNVYKTIINNKKNTELEKLCLTKPIDYYVFTSPSCFVGLVKYNANCISKTSCLVSIGPSTSKKIKEFGYNNYIVAQESTYYGIYKSIIKEKNYGISYNKA